MASPLSPLSAGLANVQTPETAQQRKASGDLLYHQRSRPQSPSPHNIDFNEDEITYEDPPSSPFVTEVVEQQQENVAPEHRSATLKEQQQRRTSRSSILNTKDIFRSSGNQSTEDAPIPSSSANVAPIDEFPPPASSRKTNTFDIFDEAAAAPQPEATPRPQLKFGEPSPLKSAIKLSLSPGKARATPSKHGDGLRDNEGLTMTMEKMMEESRRLQGSFRAEYSLSSERHITHETEERVDATIDDTCFSTFSEYPADLTTFAKPEVRSPTKSQLGDSIQTPRAGARMTPGTARRQLNTSRSPSPTPRRSKNSRASMLDAAETTNLLIDFTQQMEAFSTSTRQSPSRPRLSPTKSATEPNLLHFINNQRSPAKGGNGVPSTPSQNRNDRNLLNLLDFELPPPSTPRSMPTITVRELESLKSSYQSEISSLTASLSGRQAEVESLKKAVSDAERRVGEAQELVREERSTREHAEQQKADWEKRGHEVEQVLNSIREELFRHEKEREELLRRVAEADRRADDAEAKASDAETRAVEAEGRVVDTTTLEPAGDVGRTTEPRFTAEEVQKQIDEKVATLCRELHVVYKKKHETKVAALKKSYEAKAEKRHSELQKNVDDLIKQIEELKLDRNATLSGVLPSDLPSSAGGEHGAAQTRKLEEQTAELQELKAQLAGVMEEMKAVKIEHKQCLKELEQERVEKGELVAAVDEMLFLQNDIGSQGVEDFRKSLHRPSGLKGPGFGAGAGAGQSRIAAPGLSRSTSGGRSKLMSNIERMGGRGLQ